MEFYTALKGKIAYQYCDTHELEWGINWIQHFEKSNTNKSHTLQFVQAIH